MGRVDPRTLCCTQDLYTRIRLGLASCSDGARRLVPLIRRCSCWSRCLPHTYHIVSMVMVLGVLGADRPRVGWCSCRLWVAASDAQICPALPALQETGVRGLCCGFPRCPCCCQLLWYGGGHIYTQDGVLFFLAAPSLPPRCLRAGTLLQSQSREIQTISHPPPIQQK